MFGDYDLFPGRVSEEAVEAGSVAEEHFGERRREVQRHQGAHGFGDGGGLAEQDFLVEVLRQVAGLRPMAGDHVERGSGPRHRFLHFRIK